jgi:uncharacterized protein (UPF0335 family)
MTSPSEPAAGHNSAGLVRSYIDRISSIDAEIAAQREDRKAIFAEAKAEGLDTATIRRLLRLLGKDQQKLTEENELLRLYGQEVGFDPFS